jgi:hypothetical protein
MTKVQTERLISLDVFRGMTIAAMILVNNPGTSPVYWPLDHAEWNGLTPTDWIFPFFLFIVGVAIPISLGKRVEDGIDRNAYLKIFTRAASIFALGLAISILPFFQFVATDAPDWLKILVWLLFTASLFFLLLRNFKVAGILAESASSGGRVAHAVVGIGVNVNAEEHEFSAELRGRVASCRTLSGVVWDRAAVLADLLGTIEAYYDRFRRDGFGTLASAYEARLWQAGRAVSFEREGGRWSGRVAGVARDGALVVTQDDGRRVELYSEQVEVLE